MPDRQEKFGDIAHSLSFSAVGIHFVVAIVVGLAIGLWLDRLFGAKPLMLLLWLFFGIAEGFLNLAREARRLHAREDNTEPARPGDSGGEH